MSEDRTPNGLRCVKPDEAQAHGNTDGQYAAPGKAAVGRVGSVRYPSGVGTRRRNPRRDLDEVARRREK
jgi:hypothetical protein